MLIQKSQSYAGEQGFSLIETVVAIAILLIVVSGVMNLIYQGTTSSQLQQERITAAYLAAEAIEFLRADRDTYWLDDLASNTFDDWLNNEDVSACLGSDGCIVDARFGFENIDACSGDCRALRYNASSKLYSYGSGVNWRDSRYRRTVEIDAVDHENDGDDDEAIVTVTVSWQRQGGDSTSITMKESLTGWWR